jgi:hypothetical protein
MRRQMRAVRDTVVRPANVCQPRYAIKKAQWDTFDSLGVGGDF